MIHELRTYTLHPGTLPKYMEAAATIGRPIRGNDYGVNHGYWTSEFGTLNQIWHLWSYASLDAREESRQKLAKNERWTKEYVPVIRPFLQRQDIRFLKPEIDLKPPAKEGNIYEIRMYRTNVGGVKPWLDLYKKVLQAREKYSKIVGLWSGEAPQPNEVVHMWAYESLNHRAQVRGSMGNDPDWKEFISKSPQYLAEMQSVCLIPTSYSSMK